jgi:hypothetical protein
VTHRFALTPGADTSEIRLIGPRGPVPVERWALEAPDALLPGVYLAQRLMASESAVGVEEALLIGAATVAGLSVSEAQRLDLPALAEAMARLTATGLIAKPGYFVALEWIRLTGQPILGARRLGPWLEIGGQLRRLPDALVAIAEAVARVNAAGDRQEDRLLALADLHEALPHGAGMSETSGLVGAIHIAVATSLSLDLKDEGARLAPVLHGFGDTPDAPLLPQAQQAAFEQRFHAAATVPPSYTLGGQWHVVPQPALRRALEVVKRINSDSLSSRRAFFANPRPFLREALGEEIEETLIESLLKETPAYASRVIGLGMWKPRVVPWSPIESQDWFGPGAPTARPKGLMIGERCLPLTIAQAQRLHDEIIAARAAGETQKIVDALDGPLAIPIDEQTLQALRAIGAKGPARARPNPSEALLIETNENDVGAEEFVRRQRPGETTLPHGLRTPLKSHQSEGLSWLQQAWTGGLPGVLLADDMGLGKTLQGLAFLSWLRQGMDAGLVEQAPLLVVAPTGLLRNWRAEHDKHLEAPGLGHCMEAFGSNLKTLKRRRSDGRPGIDVRAFQQASWVLTTYETLRDYDVDFGQVRFAAAVFDEAQKIKTPGVRMTDACKAMHCEFRVALTGTPVENRLADLWCIVDSVHPGLLYDLKSFSAEYERTLDADKLARLKGTLERPIGGRVAVMKRRLKEDRLPDLPPAAERRLPRTMPAPQLAAYEAALDEARAAQAPGAVLAALQRLRAISLHPAPDGQCADNAFINQSARFLVAVETLDDIALAREKVLIFLDDIALQARLASLLQRRYRLKAPPGIVSGEVAGPRRQSLVDAFQSSDDGFGAMILSPRAGGVGLTLTRANHVLHLSRWWNPAVEDQCTGRVHRIGQIRPVHIHLPMATLDGDRRSFDENLDALLARKRKLIRETLMPPDASAESDRDELLRRTVA